MEGLKERILGKREKNEKIIKKKRKLRVIKIIRINKLKMKRIRIVMKKGLKIEKWSKRMG